MILPDENRKDWEEVPPDIRDKMTVHFVKHISEALPIALRPK